MRLFLGVGYDEDGEPVGAVVLDGITGMSDTYHQDMRFDFFGGFGGGPRPAEEFEAASVVTGWDIFDDGILEAQFESRPSQVLRTEDGVFPDWKLVDTKATPVVFATPEVLEGRIVSYLSLNAFAEIVEEWNPEAASLLREAARERERERG